MLLNALNSCLEFRWNWNILKNVMYGTFYGSVGWPFISYNNKYITSRMLKILVYKVTLIPSTFFFKKTFFKIARATVPGAI